MSIIVGISAYFHDSACCLLRDGVLVAAAQEERFTRRKHDSSLPKLAFRYCLEEAGVSICDVDAISYYEDPQLKLERQVWMTLPDLSKDQGIKMWRSALRPKREIREVLGFDNSVEICKHHQAHAASSFFYSGFDEAAILTVDGVGEWATTAYGWGRGAELELFEEVHFPDSLGLLYSTITGYLGFSVNDGEYKVMGLAPYGEPLYADKVRKLIEMHPDGQYRLNLEYFDFNRHDRMHSELLPDLFGQPARTRETEISQFHKDLARSLQVVLEEVLVEKARYLHAKTGAENLCMAGGVALNCVANSRILRDTPFKNLFVQPAANDAGTALGAAALTYARMEGRRIPGRGMEHAYLGPSYSSDEIANLLEATPLDALDFRDRENELLRTTAERLAQGKVVGWFQGRMEFGPRALGSRSILADPRDSLMRDRINALVKKREAFRPFAPAVLESKADEHFDLDHPSPFMLETCQVTSKLDLPAITHVDGSARVQTVNSDSSPRFAALLEQFDERTGCPILLNTSFNMRDEPIVCTPVDALLCFTRSDIDTLVLGDFVIDRANLSESWQRLFRGMGSGPKSEVSHSVYTLF